MTVYRDIIYESNSIAIHPVIVVFYSKPHAKCMLKEKAKDVT